MKMASQINDECHVSVRWEKLSAYDNFLDDFIDRYPYESEDDYAILSHELKTLYDANFVDGNVVFNTPELYAYFMLKYG